MQTQLPPFKEQEDKIIQAYFRNEIKPMDMNFCFCGTLSDGLYEYARNRKRIKIWRSRYYTFIDFKKMEDALMQKLGATNEDGWVVASVRERDKDYEENLFSGMCAALEVLKSIHIEHGQLIEEPILLTKRVLTT